MLITEEGEIKTSLEDDLLKKTLVKDAEIAIRNKSSVTKHYDAENGLTGFVELVSPAVSVDHFRCRQ